MKFVPGRAAAGRCGVLLLLLAAVPLSGGAAASLLPDRFGKFTLSRRAPVTPIDPPELTAEYGLEASDSATYSGPQNLDVTVWRLKDSTAALAFYQWRRANQPAQWAQAGNYVLHFASGKPRGGVAAALANALPVSPAQPLPLLPGYLPQRGLTPGSERYLLGDVSLRQFEPRISSHVARFDLGAEAEAAHYQTHDGAVDLAVFSYPTPQIARLRLGEFERLPGAAARRSGPLVAVAFGPPEAAVPLAESVGYEASVTMNEATRDYSGNPGDMLIAIFKMIGYILLFCVGAGLAFAGIRRIQDRGFGTARAPEPMIRLHLEDR
mgnify:CR=1 FL=1